MKRIFLIIAGVFAVLAIIGGVVLYNVFLGRNEFAGQNDKTFLVSRGQTFASIVDSLEAQGIIRNRELFVFVAKTMGGTNRIQIGKYSFGSGISNMDLFYNLREGKYLTLISITIPEGYRARAQARIFARSIGIDSTRYVQLVHDQAFIHSLGIDARSLEGYLMPETYSFYWQQEETDVIKAMVEEFRRFYTDALKARADSLGWTTNQVLTFASIVEGEAVIPAERPIIAGVYHNRLRKGMKLEADPTIQYMFENGPRRVLYSDLKSDNPYNTYRIKGLPPGPVNNPGKASILAALYPARNKYLFFVADGQGGHRFATNYAEHLRYVQMYRRQRSAQSRPAVGADKGRGPGVQ